MRKYGGGTGGSVRRRVHQDLYRNGYGVSCSGQHRDRFGKTTDPLPQTSKQTDTSRPFMRTRGRGIPPIGYWKFFQIDLHLTLFFFCEVRGCKLTADSLTHGGAPCFGARGPFES